MHNSKENHYDVIILGAGISGISAAYHIQKNCPDRTFAILEGRQNIGGTWDLFKYPGIRSDSDMYTFGFSFRPWTNPKSIADGSSIMEYLHETMDEFQLHDYVHFDTKITKANWSSEEARWYLSGHKSDGSEVLYSTNFFYGCTGYYNYDQGYTPEFEDIESFQGEVIHPQKWPENLDYSNKKIVVIGSGATAITLIPNLAKSAAHVTMLQRSPTYVVAEPAKDKWANLLNRILPSKLAYSITRWRKISLGSFRYKLCKKYPKLMGGLIIKGVKKELGETCDVEKHFTPSYNPWDQRICLAPDGDFFEVLKSDKADVVTDHIERFTKNGILLRSGQELDADIIVTATGLSLLYFGGIKMSLDDKVIDKSDLIIYRGVMFSGLPNLAMASGYTNASWTLKCDLTSEFVARVMNHMSDNNYDVCTPIHDDKKMDLMPFVDFTSSYFLRHLDQWPKQGSEFPWKLKQSYFVDRKLLGKAKMDDGVLSFEKTVKKEDAVSEVH